MVRRLFILSLACMSLGSQISFSNSLNDADENSSEEEAVSTKNVAEDNKANNQILMYRMLNYQTQDPSSVSYYRRWKKERKLEWLKLEWLANHKNLTVPGKIDDGPY